MGYVTIGEAASRAGIEKGDTIEFVNGSRVAKWEDLITVTALSPERDLKLKFVRNGIEMETVLTPEPSKSGAGIGGFFPPMAARIADVSSGYPAESAGLLGGDLITSIDGTQITHWAELELLIHDNKGPIEIIVDREGQKLEFSITPKFVEERESYLIGVTRAEDMIQKTLRLLCLYQAGR